MNKKKLPFFQLTAIFGLITLMVLLYSWASAPKGTENSGMMQDSMGEMMKMHLENTTVSDLVRPSEGMQDSQGSNSMAGHHDAQYGFLKVMHYLTTATIVILLPFIIAGTVFLGIIWLK